MTFVLSCLAWLPAKYSNAQTAKNRFALHLSENFHDFNVSILKKKFSSFDSALSHTFRTGIQYYINNHWTFSTGISNGFFLNQVQEGKLVKKSFVTGIDVDILYKFNNGNRLSEQSLIGPFFSFGYDVAYLSANRESGLNPMRVCNEYGFGVNLRCSPSTSIVIHSSVYQQLGGDFNNHINHRLAFVYNLGANKNKINKKEKDMVNPLISDRDKDGVADEDDVCPDMAGLPEYAGCHPNILSDTSWKTAMDSLIKKVAFMKREMDSFQIEAGVVKSELNKCKNEKIIKQTPVEPEFVPEIKKTEQPKIVVEVKKSVEEEKKPKPPEEINPKKESNEAPAYYVVAISTKQFNLAKLTADRLDKDYPRVEILPQPNGFYRVGIYATRSRSEALKVLDYAKTHGITSAWISLE